MTTSTLTRSGSPATAPAAPETSPRPVVRASRVWWRAYRHHLRVLRTRSLAWILVVAGVGAGVAAGFADLYPSEAQRRAMAASVEGIPAFEALFGRTVALDTLEGFVLWRWGGFAVLLVAVWGMFSATSTLRGAEESGHAEPIRAGVIGPRGVVVAALAAMFTWFVALAAAIGFSHAAAGMDASTAFALGAALALLAALFAAFGALAAQLVDTRRRANAVVGVILGIALATRVVAASSSAPDWLWGATPFGWTTFLHADDDARRAVLLAFAISVTAVVAAAVGLARRDLHGARVTSDVSRPDARPIGGLVGLARHTTRGPATAWGAATVLSALVFGLMARDMADAMGDLPETVEMAAQIGWVIDTPLGVVSSMLLFLTFVLGLFAASLASAIRDEESSWRIEPLLTRPVSRSAWLLSRVGVAAAVIVVTAVAMVAAAWVGAAVTGASLPLGDAPVTAVNLVPVAWMFLGLGVAVFGVAPRMTTATVYALVLASYVADLVGGILDVPEDVLRYGPYRHVAAVPAADLAVGPAILMVLVGLVGTAIGVAAFRRRDLREA